MSSLFLSNVSIDFPIYDPPSQSLRNSLVRAATGGLIAPGKGRHLGVQALKEVSLKVSSGDRIGVIGHNGSGKSTLLRCLAGIYEPSSGEIHRSGSIASLIDIGLGINPENTGKENIFLRGQLLGLSKKQIGTIYDEILDFAELEDFIHLPVRTYSTGMLMRLAFAVSTSVRADILIMDEWLSVGDGAFAARDEKRLTSMVEDANILVIASHQRSLIDQTATKVIWLENGRVRDFGPTQQITGDYFEGLE
jgi:lipopolysaccharide transport system ATP-binding protein